MVALADRCDLFTHPISSLGLTAGREDRMGKVEDGGSAFPNRASGHVEESRGSADNNLSLAFAGGMSLRDYFAAAALTGIIAAYTGQDVPLPATGMAAANAYDYADDMLKKRIKV